MQLRLYARIGLVVTAILLLVRVLAPRLDPDAKILPLTAEPVLQWLFIIAAVITVALYIAILATNPKRENRI